jgi:hypothetical protein
MAHIIIVDHRSNNGGVSVIKDEDENIMIYDNYFKALEEPGKQFLAKSFPCFILDLDTGETE